MLKHNCKIVVTERFFEAMFWKRFFKTFVWGLSSTKHSLNNGNKTFCSSWNSRFEFVIFSFNTYVYHLTCGFIASACVFNLLTRAFNLPTRAFSLPTRAFEHATRAFGVLTRECEPVTLVFELITREFKLATHEFELVTRGFELVTRGFELVSGRFELVTRGFELVTCVLLFHKAVNSYSYLGSDRPNF